MFLRGLRWLLVALGLSAGCDSATKAKIESTPPAASASAQTVRVGPISGGAQRLSESLLEPPAGAERTSSGLAFQTLQSGVGADRARVGDRVEIEYRGWRASGAPLGKSRRPQRYQLDELISGWREALLQMAPGEQRRLWVPAVLGYGTEPSVPGAPAGDLIYELTLVRIVRPPPAPHQLAAPASAQRTASGLAFEVLRRGSGTERPTANSAVELRHTGWTAEGRLFYSHVHDDRPYRKRLSQLHSGLAEGVQLMVAGEKRRLWVPGKLTQHPVVPGGERHESLVIDVELVAVLD